MGIGVSMNEGFPQDLEIFLCSSNHCMSLQIQICKHLVTTYSCVTSYIIQCNFYKLAENDRHVVLLHIVMNCVHSAELCHYDIPHIYQYIYNYMNAVLEKNSCRGSGSMIFEKLH